uniref:Uncharacterized protein n=1 Tax=Anguilla anguilla TaxID=7936 RepID=A0A0E9U0U1_ANGAN
MYIKNINCKIKRKLELHFLSLSLEIETLYCTKKSLDTLRSTVTLP